MPSFIQFPCPCGRTLRAREEQAGTAVKCWSCQAHVVVPRARTAERLARESLESARGVLGAETFFLALFAAAVGSGLFAIPKVGLPIGLVFLAVGVVRYVDILRRSGLRGTPDPSATRLTTPAKRTLLWVARWAAGVLAVMLWLSAILLRNGLMDRGRILLGLGGAGVIAIAVASVLLVPLGILCATGCDREGALSPGQALRALGAHPVATAAALLIVPLGLVAIEAATVAAAMQQDWFKAMVADFFPTPGTQTVEWVVPPPRMFDYVNTPLDIYLNAYWNSLGKGYCLATVIPASLPFGVHTRLSPYLFNGRETVYLAVRVVFSTLILTAAGSLLAIQARWLGLIVSIDQRTRPVPTPAPAESAGL